MKNLLLLLFLIPLFTLTQNAPDSLVNLALSKDAKLFSSVKIGKGVPVDVLYNPIKKNYETSSNFAEHGVAHNVTDAFTWGVEWQAPKLINYMTFGGSFPNQPQPTTKWKISYFNDKWQTLDEGTGGWIDSGIYEKKLEVPITTTSVKIEFEKAKSIHIRGRGGKARLSDDSNNEIKATLIQLLPYEVIDDEEDEELPASIYKIAELEKQLELQQMQLNSLDIKIRVLTMKYEILSRKNVKDLTSDLSDMKGDFAIPGDCNSLMQTYVVFSDVVTNGFKLVLGNHKLIVHGKVYGKITKTCDSAEIIEQ